MALAEVAQSSIDVQYFMWGRDTVGRVLLERLIAAANRGVRIRFLIDDYWATGYDLSFETLDAFPNIEVRVFNPFARARMRVTQYLGRFTELNRRMHNKLFVADARRRSSADATSRTPTSAWGRRSATATSTSWRSARWCRRRRLPSTAPGTVSGPIRSARW